MNKEPRFWHQNCGSGDLTHVLFIVVAFFFFLHRRSLLFGAPNSLLQAGEFPLGIFYNLDFGGNICF